MNGKRQTLPTITSLAVLIGVVLVALFLYGAPSVAAPPPPNTPTNTPEVPPTYTFTPEPPPPTYTFTPEPPPTNTFTPQPPPTNTFTPQPPPAKPTNTPRPTDVTEPQPNPECQSSVTGVVVNAAGQAVAGASVNIQGQGWSRGMLTNDSGRYGFAGLCPGDATLQAALPGGQTLPSVTVSLDGENNVELNLGTQAPATTASPSPTATATRPIAQDAPDAEPGMPATGFPGWLVIGGALVGALLLLASVRWSRSAPR